MTTQNLCAWAATLTLTSALTAAPSIGGTPVHTQDDVFNGGPWTLDVSSYVYDSNSDLPSGFMLNPGEFLFIYLLDADDASDVSVNSFSVGNPTAAMITSVGFSDLVPAGLASFDREDPYIFGYSGPSQASIFNYTGDLSDPFSTIEPGEWSLVWYVAQTSGWTTGAATGTGAGIGDTQFVPVPVPAPGVMAILSMAGLLCLRRRTR